MRLPSLTATTTHFLDALMHGPDEGAWSVLDGRYRPIVRGFVLRAGLKPEDAADVAQQTMLDTFTAIREGRYQRSRGRLRTWIMTVARRRAMDLLRGQYRHGDKRSDRGGEQELNAVETGLPSDADWAEEEKREIVDAAIRMLREDPDLSDVHKRAFELVQMQGVPPATVAEECEIGVDQVYVIKHRILKRLREFTTSLQEAYDTDE